MSAISNRVAVFTAPRRIELRSEPVPEPGRGEALVRIRACALCTMEQRLWMGAQDDYPIAAGHEAAGEIVAVGGDSSYGLAVGQRVAIAFLDRCMQCAPCRRGDTHLCVGKLQGRKKNAFRRIGGLSDYALVPTWKLFPMPPERSFDEIALCEPLACVVHSIHKADLCFGDDVLVIGGGTMGQLHLRLARLRGARVFVSELDAEKRRLALASGATAAFDPAQVQDGLRAVNGDGQADIVFITFGTRETAVQASTAIRLGGRIVYYGGFPEDAGTHIEARRLHHEEIVLTGSRGQTLEDWQQATRLITSQLVDIRSLISGTYPLDCLSEALDRAIDPSTHRIIVQP